MNLHFFYTRSDNILITLTEKKLNEITVENGGSVIIARRKWQLMAESGG